VQNASVFVLTPLELFDYVTSWIFDSGLTFQSKLILKLTAETSKFFNLLQNGK